jgi:two-component system, cell cycle response regulator DivK
MARHVLPHVPTVLLVEDSQDDRTMYAEYLRLRQFRTVEIDNTADAFALAPTVDAVVTGIRVPGPFDGIELVRRLREDERTKQKPVIVLTACTYEPDQRRAYAAGCDVFLPKPCLPETLMAEISRVLPVPGRPVRTSESRTRHKRYIA